LRLDRNRGAVWLDADGDHYARDPADRDIDNGGVLSDSSRAAVPLWVLTYQPGVSAEPTLSAREAKVLPLNYTRDGCDLTFPRPTVNPRWTSQYHPTKTVGSIPQSSPMVVSILGMVGECVADTSRLSGTSASWEAVDVPLFPCGVRPGDDCLYLSRDEYLPLAPYTRDFQHIRIIGPSISGEITFGCAAEIWLPMGTTSKL